jgi:outer membrane protein OmpA-like peptidoglycan-associated protein
VLPQFRGMASSDSPKGKAFMKPTILVAGLAALALSACSTTNAYTGDQQLSNTTKGAVVGTGGGAVLGALVGQATGNDPRVGALIGAGLGGLTGAATGHYMDQQETELRAQLLNSGVSVTRVGNQIILNMPSNITFNVDSAIVQPDFNGTLSAVGLVLKKYDKTLIDVTGHTDNTGTVAHNQDLSQRRAVAVATILANQGLSQQRFYIAGQGENDPIASNANEDGRAQNRRVEIQLSPVEQG